MPMLDPLRNALIGGALATDIYHGDRHNAAVRCNFGLGSTLSSKLPYSSWDKHCPPAYLS